MFFFPTSGSSGWFSFVGKENQMGLSGSSIYNLGLEKQLQTWPPCILLRSRLSDLRKIVEIRDNGPFGSYLAKMNKYEDIRKLLSGWTTQPATSTWSLSISLAVAAWIPLQISSAPPLPDHHQLTHVKTNSALSVRARLQIESYSCSLNSPSADWPWPVASTWTHIYAYLSLRGNAKGLKVT